jgi:polysaccharide biosynthesis PFTS motif protein
MRAQPIFRLPLIGPVARAFARRRIRRVMRGFRRLRTEGRLAYPADIMRTLTIREVRPGNMPAWFVGAASSAAELAVRQYMLIRVVGSLALNNAVLASVGGDGPVVYPLPAEWRRYLRGHGLRIAGGRSTLLWWAYVAALWAYGVLSVVRILKRSLRVDGAQPWRDAGEYAYFVALGPGNVPRPGRDGRSFDILTWYWQWPGRIANLTSLAHSVSGAPPVTMPPVKVLPSGLPPLEGAARWRFLWWGLRATASSLGRACIGQWGQAVLLSEAAEAAALRAQEAPPLAREYLLHASNVIYRYLWSYEAERRGATCTMYCYSTNSEPFKLADGYTTPLHSWQLMSWPRVLVWNRGQADFMRRSLGARAGAVQLIEVGPIWFHSSAEGMPHPGPGAVAVFDVQPQRTSRRQSLATPHEYYAPATATAFLTDLVTVAAECGRPVVFKRKRRAGAIVHRGYDRLLERFQQSGAFMAIDPDISAVRVVEACDVVVSMAFTSTALIGVAHGRPSIYYDPLGIIQPDDRAAHGLPIIQGIDQLRIWFASLPASRPPAGPAGSTFENGSPG